MSERRLLLWLRLLTGAGFMYQGASAILDKFGQADLFAAHTGWQAWPIVGGMRPLELTLWLALLEFGLGVFLFGGLLTRILAAVGMILAAFQLIVLGFSGGPLNLLLMIGAAVVLVRGGGGGTMDAALGAMQRRSIERERERDAERARQKAERDAERARQKAERPAGSLPSGLPASSGRGGASE